MARRGSAPGERRGGRRKGTPNRLTREVKDLVEGALEKLGGEDWLVAAAKKNPGPFMALLGKLIPKDLKVQTPDGTPVRALAWFLQPVETVRKDSGAGAAARDGARAKETAR